MGENPKVYIVEDNVFNHQLYRDAFTHAGFEVTLRPHADGPLVDEVIAAKPDIISMDIMIGGETFMPERDGLIAIELLKKDTRTRDIPIMILSNLSEEGKVARAKELGVVDYINASGHSLPRIPEYFLRYLKNPSSYKPVHELFQHH